jgi:phage terminase large subunit GpA-like protein
VIPDLKTTKQARTRFFRSLYPRERWSPSEWAERCRHLSPEESDEPGPYRFDRTPYWRFPCDLIARPGVEELVCLKGAQIGWSEMCRNVMGYWIDMKPGPCMVLMPDRPSAQAFREERMEPLMKHTPAVRRYVSDRAWDSKKTSIRFTNSMRVFFVWAGSKTGTKSRPIRYLLLEEPDEYPAFSSTGGDPMSKAEKRLTTAKAKGLSRQLTGGTPTTRNGNVFKRWEMCAVRYHLWLPCPHCGGYQTLNWKQVKYAPVTPGEERPAHAERIKRDSAAWYECEHQDCRREIRDHQKPGMLTRGVWATEDQVVTRDGRVAGPERAAKRVGVKISSLYSPWVSFPQLAAEWVEAQGDPDVLADFINQRLAEPFEEQRAKTEPTLISEKAKGAPAPGIIPPWTRVVIATADTQGTTEQDGYFWYVIRAWGHEKRSQLVEFGVAASRQELLDRTVGRSFPVEGTGHGMPVYGLWADSGGPRWLEVYEMAQRDSRVHPTKGANRPLFGIAEERPQRKHGVVLWEIDTDKSKDELHRLIHDPDRTRWMPHNAVNADYCAQMCSESKVWNPSQKREEWVEVVKKNNHLWDCEHQQVAVALRYGLNHPEPPPAAPAQPAPRAADRPSWMPDRPSNWTR